MTLYRFAGTNRGLLLLATGRRRVTFPQGAPPLTPVAFTARLVVTGHSIPDAPLQWPWGGVITDAGFTPDMITSTGPFGSAESRWNLDPAGLDKVREYLSEPGASADLFLGTEAFGGSYGSPGRASVHGHIQFSDAYGYALLWHNLAASTGAQTFYSNFWRNDMDEVFGSSWRNSHNVPVSAPYNLTEVELWNSIIDHVNANRAGGTREMRLVPWLEVMLAIYDAIEAGTLTGMVMTDFFIDDVHPSNLGTWVLMAVMMAVMYHRHPDELSHSISDQYGGAPFTVNSGYAAQLRPLIWATCVATPRTGMEGFADGGVDPQALMVDGHPLMVDGFPLRIGA
jgi:hypothetical protein